jgi:hypothetical protein
MSALDCGRLRPTSSDNRIGSPRLGEVTVTHSSFRAAVAPALLAAFALIAPSANATPIASAGQITYTEKLSIGPTFGGPTFNPDGTLLSAGAGHPTLGFSFAPTQSTGAPADIFFPPFPGISLTAVPAAIGTGTMFAGATTGLTAFNAGPSPYSAVFWAPMTLGSTVVPGFATVDSTATAIVRNDLGFAAPGYGLSFLGFIYQIPHTLGGYVATSLTAEIGGVTLAPIVLATDGFGPLPDVELGGAFADIAFIGYDPFNDMDYFLAYGFSLTPLLSIPNGGLLVIDGAITGTADPGAGFFDVFVDIDPQLPTDFPILARITNVPEPGTILLLTVSLIGLAGLRRRMG